MDERPNDPIEDEISDYPQADWQRDNRHSVNAHEDAAPYVVDADEIDGELVPIADASEDRNEWLENDGTERESAAAFDQDQKTSSSFDGNAPLNDEPIVGHQDPVLLTTLSPPSLEVQPGASVDAQVQLLNNGDRVALFEVLFEGWIDPAWLDVNPIYKTLQPGERVAIDVAISPPCRPSVLAGQRQIVVVVRSPDYPGRESRQVALLNVLPYDDVQLGAVTPLVSEISWNQRSAPIDVMVTNNGNHIVQTRIRGQAESTDFYFEPVDPQQIEISPFLPEDLLLTLESGQKVLLRGSIRPQRLPMLGMQARVSTFRILANVVGKTQVPRAVGAQVRCRPLIGPRRMALLSMLFAFALIAFSILGVTGFGLARIVSSLPVAPGVVDGQPPAAPSPSQPPVVAIVVPVDMPVPTAAQSTGAGGATPIVVSVGDAGGEIVTPIGANVTDAGAGRDTSVPLVVVGEISPPGSTSLTPSEDQPIGGTQPVVVGPPPTPDRSELTYAQMFQEVALRYDLDWRMLAAQAYVESSFDTLALGSDGDLGLMQVLPRTWKEWAPAVDVNDPFDAYSNVLVAGVYLDYLRSNLSRNGFPEARWMLIAYNWGPDKLNTFLADGNGWDDLPDSVRRYAGDILRIAESIPEN